METNNRNDDSLNESANPKDLEEDESFVKKVRSRVSGLFSSSLSRLFKNQQSGVTRQRSVDPDENDESQPPCKRAKGMDHDKVSSVQNRDTINSSDLMGNLNSDISIETSEPIPGPSYISKKSDLRTVTSTPFESCSRGKYLGSECTSGYSSIKSCERQSFHGKSERPEGLNKTSEKTVIEGKSLFNFSTPETPCRSLFTNTTESPKDKNASLSMRRPSFNTSNFGSPSFVDRTLTTSRIINSPFYNGTTIYGGASAYGQQLSINETRKQQLKNSFMVKPINKNSDAKSFTSLSKTARRILETLEQCSTPMSDVKKVPLPSRNNKQGLFTKYVAANPYQKNSTNKELLVPSVSERLRMKQIQRLQDTTNEIRQIATSSTSNLNNDEYKISSESQQKHTTKMKNKITSVRPKAPTIEILDNYVLNPVPLMMPDNKCPTFKIPELNLGSPKKTSNKNEEVPKSENTDGYEKIKASDIERLKSKIEKHIQSEEKSIIIKSDANPQKLISNDIGNKRKDSCIEYTFSKPVVIADNLNSIIAINNFKFSEPLSKKIKLPENDQLKSSDNGTDKVTNGSITHLSDPLLEKFKAPIGTWECQTCLIRNKSKVNKCAACETPRVEKGQDSINTSASFGSQFAKKIDEWDCSTCFVRNKVQNAVCVACLTPKVSKLEANGISHKVKSTSINWECETCWVRNKNDTNKCVACGGTRNVFPSKPEKNAVETKKCTSCLNEMKENGDKCSKCDKKVNIDFPSHLKLSDTWECGTCLIRNKNDSKTCAACETPREKLNENIKIEQPKVKADKWECPTCMVRNDAAAEKCPCCETAKPGITLINKSNVNMFNFGVNKMQFNFGIPKNMESNNSAAVSSTSSLFANNTNQISSSNTIFKFGISPENTKDKDDKKETLPATNLVESKNETKPDSSSPAVPLSNEKEKPEISEQKSVPVFKFGAPTTESKETPTNLFKFVPPSNPIAPSTESVKKTENKVDSFVATTTPQAEPNKLLFSFGSKSNDVENQTTKSSFSFGSLPSSNQLGFNFNSTKTDNQPTPSVPSFVSNPIPQSSSTNMKNGGFNFGSAPLGAGQAAVFSFGSAQTPPAAVTPSKGGFDFSSSAKPTGGFNFSASGTSFDAGSKPTFNFTGGSIPTFSANPTEAGGGPQPVRKFKKAVRRTQR